MDFIGAFADELQRPDVLPDLLALYIAGMAELEIDILQNLNSI